VSDGRELEFGAGRQGARLALLLAPAGEVVSTERMSDALWGEQAPTSAAKLVQGCVSRLRRSLPPDTIGTRRSGYLPHSSETDAREFERLSRPRLRRLALAGASSSTAQDAAILIRLLRESSCEPRPDAADATSNRAAGRRTRCRPARANPNGAA